MAVFSAGAIGSLGSPDTWVSAFNAADVNSLANGSSVRSTVTAIANGTNLDGHAALSVALGSITAASPNYIGVYLYPLNADRTTYGDHLLPTAGTPAAVTPGPGYWVGNIYFPTGAATIKGALWRIPLIRVTFAFVLYNQSGAALAASANTVSMLTYNP